MVNVCAPAAVNPGRKTPLPTCPGEHLITGRTRIAWVGHVSFLASSSDSRVRRGARGLVDHEVVFRDIQAPVAGDGLGETRGNEMRGSVWQAVARFGTVAFIRSRLPMITRATIGMNLARADDSCRAKAANCRILPVVVDHVFHDDSTGVPVFMRRPAPCAQRNRPAGLARSDPRTHSRLQDQLHRRVAGVEHRVGGSARS